MSDADLTSAAGESAATVATCASAQPPACASAPVAPETPGGAPNSHGTTPEPASNTVPVVAIEPAASETGPALTLSAPPTETPVTSAAVARSTTAPPPVPGPAAPAALPNGLMA